jgi:TLD
MHADYAATAARYYGSGESFVFSTDIELSRVRVHMWTRKNSFFQLSTHEFFAVGGGGRFALRVDDELAHGTTAKCSTFDNAPLTVAATEANGAPDAAEHVEFEIVSLEVWTPVTRGHLAPH